MGVTGKGVGEEVRNRLKVKNILRKLKVDKK